MKYPVMFWIQIAALVALTVLASYWVSTRDDTDGANSRSGMVLYHDALTGCEYLGNPLGGITPRLNRAGKQLCRDRP